MGSRKSKVVSDYQRRQMASCIIDIEQRIQRMLLVGIDQLKQLEEIRAFLRAIQQLQKEFLAAVDSKPKFEPSKPFEVVAGE